MKRKKSSTVARFVKAGAIPLYPEIYCLDEDKPIGVSKICVSMNVKVTDEHWKKDNSIFLEGYHIDMSKQTPDCSVKCPVCGGNVDFRLFPSNSVPDLK